MHFPSMCGASPQPAKGAGAAWLTESVWDKGWRCRSSYQGGPPALSQRRKERKEGASPAVQTVKNLPAMQETWV